MAELNPKEQPEKLELSSFDVAEEKRRELYELFPEVRTEGGKIDFDRLKAVLGETIDGGRERYGMNWPGKAECVRTIQAPSMGTLLPCPDESVNWDTTENLIIEGDNLEVLKLLQKSYLGRVKMIYIDPPYNTGNDFIYPDNYSESLQTYMEYTGQVDESGRRFGTNSDSDGRFHSKWMNMILPRLHLARALLSEQGAVFITIDDGEVDNLKKLCNDVFGEENFVACIIWQKKYSPQNDAKWFSDMHDYVLLYAKTKESWRPELLPRTAEQDAAYQNPDKDARGPWKATDSTCNKSRSQRPNLYYPMKNPVTGEDIFPSEVRVWRYSKDIYEEKARDNRIWWGADGRNKVPAFKSFLSEVKQGRVPTTLWGYEEAGHNQVARQELNALLPGNEFDTPKPTQLIKLMLQVATTSDGADIVLDFFAGSGTTGQAVLEQNMEDGGNRSFVLVQLPEPLEDKEFTNIAEITKARVKRSIARIKEQASGKLAFPTDSSDLGFRCFKLAESNFETWNSQVSGDKGALVEQLELHVDHIKSGGRGIDLLFEILLKSGFSLSTPVASQLIAGKEVFSVSEGSMVICLDRELNLELIRAIADQKPERVVLLDAGFAGNDQLKTNAVQTFKTKGVTSFKVV